MKKSIFLLFILLPALLVISGCTKNIKSIFTGGSDGVAPLDWTSRLDLDYGFDLHYPKDWEVLKAADPESGYALRSKQYEPVVSGAVAYDGEINIAKIPNPSNLEIADLMENHDNRFYLWQERFAFTEISVNGNKALFFNEIKEVDIGRKTVYIKSGGSIYCLEYIYNDKNNNIEKIFDEVVNRIIFLQVIANIEVIDDKGKPMADFPLNIVSSQTWPAESSGAKVKILNTNRKGQLSFLVYRSEIIISSGHPDWEIEGSPVYKTTFSNDEDRRTIKLALTPTGKARISGELAKDESILKNDYFKFSFIHPNFWACNNYERLENKNYGAMCNNITTEMDKPLPVRMDVEVIKSVFPEQLMDYFNYYDARSKPELSEAADYEIAGIKGKRVEVPYLDSKPIGGSIILLINDGKLYRIIIRNVYTGENKKELQKVLDSFRVW